MRGYEEDAIRPPYLVLWLSRHLRRGALHLANVGMGNGVNGKLRDSVVAEQP